MVTVAPPYAARRPHPGAGARVAGMSLLEMLLVVALIALVGLLTVGMFSRGTAGMQLRGAGKEIASQLRLARTQAIASGQPQRFIVEPAHHRWQGAGGTASLDMMLNLIDQDFGENLVNRVCEQALTDRVRGPHDRQRLPLRARLGVQNAKVLSIIELMEGNLAEPLSLLELADSAGLSRRQIERLFRQEMGRSPARYYLEIRLDRARHLLVQSAMPVVEVAVACGFVSASHFSKCYRELYNRSPQQERADRKVTLAQAAR